MIKFDFLTSLMLIVFLMGMVFAFGFYIRRNRNHQKELERENQKLSQHLISSFALSGYLFEAYDEESAILAVMRVGNNLLGAQGCVFVPMNEWSQFLPVLNFGDLPFTQDSGWQKRLFHPAIRHACRNCPDRYANAGCSLQEDQVGVEKIFCLPLRCGGREIGVISYLFSSQVHVTGEQHEFLAEMVRMTDLALDSLREHEREISALQHIQNPSIQKEELTTLLIRLLDDIRIAMGVDLALIWVPVNQGLQTPVLLRSASSDGLDEPFGLEDHSVLHGIWKTVSKSNKTLSMENMTLPRELVRDSDMKLLALPVAWREDKLKGMLLLGSQPSHKFTRRQLMLLRTVAGQAALLIRNDMLMAQLEYQAVLDERTRLAREIHDGLAQTLAFLKMEAARMQGQLIRGEIGTVEQSLQSCYQTLSDAYLDARQAIDNLRRVPEEDFVDWLEMTAEDFRTLTGISVDVSIDSLEHNLSFAVKAQLTRIVQEAMTNIRKHANSSSVSISAIEREKEIVVEILDNGCGFSPLDTRSSQYGLRSMRERAETIGADFQIVSAPGQGTSIRLRIPIQERVKL